MAQKVRPHQGDPPCNFIATQEGPKYQPGDTVLVASDEGLDVPVWALGTTATVTCVRHHEGGTHSYDLRNVYDDPQTGIVYNVEAYHIDGLAPTPVKPHYEVQYVVRSLGQGIPGRHTCTGCQKLFVQNEIFEIGSFALPNGKYIVINVHANDACRNRALVDTMK